MKPPEFTCRECDGHLGTYCRACGNVPKWLLAECAKAGVDPMAPHVEVAYLTAEINHEWRLLRVLVDAGLEAAYAAAFALGGKKAALHFLRAAGIPNVDASGQYALVKGDREAQDVGQDAGS